MANASTCWTGRAVRRDNRSSNGEATKILFGHELTESDVTRAKKYADIVKKYIPPRVSSRVSLRVEIRFTSSLAALTDLRPGSRRPMALERWRKQRRFKTPDLRRVN